MPKCPCCKKDIRVGDCVGESSLFGSHDIGDLCEECWLEEENLIEQEGTNSPEYSSVIAERLRRYRSR